MLTQIRLLTISIMILIIGLCPGTAWPEAPQSAPMSEIIRDLPRKEIRVPEVLGMMALKCDFHMHTVFSDGVVWPTVRVEEAWREGLDAIAITEHIEGQPGKPFIGGDHNASYEIALPTAQARDILLVRAGEITRALPEGRCNALFLKDVNALDCETFMDAMKAASNQGAFVFWNHPCAYPTPGVSPWSHVQDTLLRKGWLHGVEVFNEKEWYPIALDWCVDKNLTVLSNSDIHEVTSEYYDVANRHRPMTLVLARERSLDALKEALFAGRTLAWFGDQLAGREEYLEALFKASVVLQVVESARGARVTFTNVSDIPFHIESRDPECPGAFRMAPRGAFSVSVAAIPSGDVAVTNLHPRGDEVLVTTLKPVP